MKKGLRKLLRAVADCDPDYYDMCADPNERWFAQLYIERIRQRAEEAGIRPPATLLEAGCQAGRLVVPFARLGYRVTGIDTSRFAIRRAREHAREAGVTATWLRGDLVTVLQRPHTPLYDIVVCAEVLYQSPRYRQMLEVLAASVRPGGLLCVSHRPKSYYVIEALRHGDWDTAASVLRHSEGRFRDHAYCNWQTEEDLRGLYSSLGLTGLTLYPIDRLAWLGGISPASLTELQRELWLQCELALPSTAGCCARYVLVVAARSFAPQS
jgi:SAM-dependent methyltransferase